MSEDTFLAHGVAPPRVLAEFDRIPFGDIVDRASTAGVSEARRALGESTLSLEGAAKLLIARPGLDVEELLERARERTDETFGRRILLYAPCYLSSFCVNHCVYCGFNFTMDIPRRRLTVEEAAMEIEWLASQRLQRVLLVAGDFPTKLTPDDVTLMIARARSIVDEVDLEVAPGPTSSYRKWSEAGAGGVVCYQETYDRSVYARLHPRGPKSVFDFRLGALERAGAAGMPRLGLGILLGIADPISDLMALVIHARWLQALFPQARLTVSLPRLRPAVPCYQAAYVVDDESLLRFFAVLRLALPAAGLVVSTRERPGLRQSLLRAGITQMSAGSVTTPGGHSRRDPGAGQFDVADHRSVKEVASDLERLGYEVAWTKDDHARAPSAHRLGPEAREPRDEEQRVEAQQRSQNNPA